MKLSLALVSLLPLISVSTCVDPPKGLNTSSALFILNGHDAEDGDAPHQVLIESDEVTCGGSILSANWILTAAHCVSAASDPSQLTIRYNSLKRSSGGQQVAVKAIISHPDFDPEVLVHDLALLQTAQPMALGGVNAAAIRLPAPGYHPPAGSPVTIAGWGLVETSKPGSSLPEHLQLITLPVVDYQQCQTAYPLNGAQEGSFCAGQPSELDSSDGKIPCEGDSGSGVVGGGGNGQLVGVVTGGDKCADMAPERPDSITCVGHYVHWIVEVCACGGGGQV